MRSGPDLLFRQNRYRGIPTNDIKRMGYNCRKTMVLVAEQYPYVVLHAFVVMPNHIHGIIEINRNIVGTGRDLSLNTPDPSLQPKIKSLSELMGAYKTTVSKQIHLLERTDGRVVWTGRDLSLRLHGNGRFMNISFAMKNPLKKFPITL